MSKGKILYIHPYCNKDNDDFVFLPGGIIGVINNLKTNNFDVTGINIPLEMKLNPNFDVEEFLKTIEFQIVIMDCHWYYFLHGVQEIAKICKKINPNCFVVVGGFSANFFRKKILQSTDNIDIIIRGDSENLLPKICYHLISKGKKKLREIPNITYENNFFFIRDNKIINFDNKINDYDYVDISFMKHWKEYLKIHLGREAPGISQVFSKDNFYYLPIQKGCKNSCPACGGGKFSYSILANKSKISFKSPKKIISDIIKLKKLEVSNIMISCESNLNNWCEVLTELEEKNIYVDIMFEDWQLPKKEFTKVMCSYANKTGSGFLVSVLSGNENIRKKNGKNFSNEELLEVATIISKTEKSYLCCWFAPNLVGGTKKHFQETIIFAKKLIELNRVSKKSNINVLISPMEVDITSNIYSHPSAYNFSGKLWDYEYLIKLLRFRDSGVKLGNMSYVSKDMSIEECNKLCEQFDKEILLLKEEINKTILN